jgi:hypothetical protein
MAGALSPRTCEVPLDPDDPDDSDASDEWDNWHGSRAHLRAEETTVQSHSTRMARIRLTRMKPFLKSFLKGFFLLSKPFLIYFAQSVKNL